MLDYQRIVDDLRSSLSCYCAEGDDFLRAAAADYSVACDEVNERLHQCGELLRRGLRSEAIQVANIEPNLLDAVALLDFPERAEMAEAARSCGLAPPSPLLLDIAAGLNEAYALEEPLAATLQEHRILALARGTLRARIRVLRRLNELDADNPIWQEDLQVFEKERLAQIEAEAKTATRGADAAALASLNLEISSPDWRNPPPGDLVTSVAEAQTRLYYWSVQSQFEQLAAALDAARSRFRVEDGRALRQRWNELLATSKLQPPGQVAGTVAAAFSWLAEQDEAQRKRQEREAALGTLAKAIEAERSPSRLEELHIAAADLGVVPSAVEERYQARLRVTRWAARRRLLVQLGATAAVVILLSGLIGLFVSHQRYEQQVATAASSLATLINSGHLEQADALVSELPAAVRQDVRVQEEIALLPKKWKDEKDRLSKFSQELKTANYLLGEVSKSLGDKPEQTVLNRLRDELDSVQGHLDRAKTLAITEEERAGISGAADLSSQLRNQGQQLLDQTFLAQYAEFDRQWKILDRDKAADTDTQRRKLADLQRDLQAWENASATVSAALRERVTTLKERLANLANRVQEQGQQDKDTRQITAAVGDIQAYVKAIQEYANQHPRDEGLAGYSKRVADESLGWQAVADWNKLVEELRQGGVAGLRPKAAEEEAELVKTVCDTFDDCTEGERLRRMLPYLKAIAVRDNEGERLEASLKKLFSDPLVANVWVVETEDGRRYYATAKPQVDRSFRYAIDFAGGTMAKLLRPTDAEKAKVHRAPQVTVAQQVQPILDALDDKNWEDSFCRMIAVIQADRDMDPILRMNLLQRVLTVGGRGSYCLEKAFGRHLEWFKEAKINVLAKWLDPDDKEAAEARSAAAARLQSFPEISEPSKAAMRDLAALRRCTLTTYRWIGWLHRTRDNRWQCLTRTTPDGDGRLLVVRRPSPEGKLVLADVGRLDRSTPTIDAPAGDVLVEGRPVYLVVPRPQKNRASSENE